MSDMTSHFFVSIADFVVGIKKYRGGRSSCIRI